MHSFRKLVFAAAFVASVAVGVAAWSAGTVPGDPVDAVRIFPASLKWGGNAQMHGLQTAAVLGDSRCPEPYVERIKMPAGLRLEPHSHSNEGRMVTVLSGTLYFAFGDKFDETKLKALPVGTFFTEPKDMPHYALTKGEVILQLSAIGPAGTKYVKAAPASQEKR